MIRVQIHLAETDENDKHPVIDYTCEDCYKDENKNELVIKHLDDSMERMDYDCIMRYRIWRSPSMSNTATAWAVKEICKDIANDLK
jgi:hypothetical protein